MEEGVSSTTEQPVVQPVGSVVSSPVVPPVVVPPQPETAPKKKKWMGVVIGLVILLGVGGALFWNYYGKNLWQKPEEIVIQEEGEVKEIKAKRWISCTDIREVIEEEGKLYVACLGGVLVVEKNSGKVLDQVGMSEGMRSGTATSLVKKGDELYIGTQNGFSRFNLKTRELKNVSVEEGLSSGANIELADDGEYLWVATFNGLNKYRYSDGKLEKFGVEIFSLANEINVNQLLVTPKAVYGVVVASAKAAGGVIRYDKETGTWEQFLPNRFGEGSRVDLFGLVEAGGKIVMTKNFNQVWEAEDKKGTEFVEVAKVAEVVKSLNKDGVVRIIGANDGKVYFRNPVLFAYDVKSGETKVVYPERYEGEAVNVLAESGSVGVMENGKIWAVKSGSDRNWMVLLSLDNWQTEAITLADRPINFMNVVAIINDEPIVRANDGVYVYKIGEDKFEKLPGLKGGESYEMGGVVFKPIEGTKKALIYSQACGQGCLKPEIVVYDFFDNSMQVVELPKEVVDIMGGDGPMLGALEVVEEGDGEVVFVAGSVNRKKVTLRLGDLSFVVGNGAGLVGRSGLVNCNRSYVMGENGFMSNRCENKVSDGIYEWKWESTGNGQELVQISIGSGTKQRLVLPEIKGRYTPFEAPKISPVGGLVYVKGKLYVGTDRGIGVYDSSGGNWKWVGPEKGVVELSADSFVVGERQISVINSWGGLAIIPLSEIE